MFLSGNEAVALAARDSGIALGTGYPGTPSTEILERFAALGGRAQWSPNEKVALEVAIGVAYAGAGALVTMKHVGLNVAADALFTVAYTGVSGPLVIVSADDPGMASSQNEQDNRRYAVAAGVPMLEPADSQEAYDFTRLAIDLSRRWKLPFLLRMTTRVCHSSGILHSRPQSSPAPPAHFEHDIPGRVMIPAYARPAHRRLREKLAALQAWNEDHGPSRVVEGSRGLGIVASGVAFLHALEAAPDAAIFKPGITYPLPIESIRRFAQGAERCVVIEEGDPYLTESLRAAGISVEPRPEIFRFGELDVGRVRRIVAGDPSPEPPRPPGKAPELCRGCPHRSVFETLRELGCIVAGDIGCYSLGALPPFEAMDSLVCMGASIGVGLGLRHALPAEEARRVVSVIGDSTFLHSGLTGLVEMVYNPPPTGHVVLLLDNGTTAMTGMQEHPGTGRTLQHTPSGKVIYESVARAIGVANIFVLDPTREMQLFRRLVAESLAKPELTLIVARRVCLLAASAISAYERANAKESQPECESIPAAEA
jgi:indolepyruvate ferredoxin oxidoreductase alpha subunit